MKAATTSPFAAAGAEFEEQWITWKLLSDHEEPPRREPRIPAAALPRVEEAAEPPVIPRPVYRHQQYDAVIRRMKTAQQQTGAYSPLPT